MKMPFGKYDGEEIEDIPSGYLNWCLENMEKLDSDLQTEMEAQLAMRAGEGYPRKRGRD